MNILERTKNLNSEIEELKKLRVRSSKAGKFEQLADHLEPVKEMFADLENPLDSMIDIKDIQINNEFNTLAGLSGMLNDFKDRYEEDKNNALEPFPRQDLTHVFITPLTSLATDVDENLTDAWSSWTEKKTSSGINEETLNVLSEAGIKGVTELKKTHKEIQDLSENLPQDIKTPQTVEKLGETVRKAWEKLEAPSEVVSFLREAYGEGAGLGMLSDEVKKWLKEKGLINKVKLIM